jgi:hypothetical protein
VNRGKRILRIFVAAALLFPIAAWLWLKSVESSRWSRLELRVAELRRDADRRLGPRPVLRGTSVRGNAWEDYRKAVALLEGAAGLSDATLYAARLPRGDRSKAEEVLRKLGAAVDLMQSGTRRAEVRRERLHEHERFQELGSATPLGRCVIVAGLAVCRARLLQEEDRIQDSVELLLDVCRFAGDVGGDGSIIAAGMGNLMCSSALNELGHLVREGRLPRPLLVQTGRELQEIDRSLPRHGDAMMGQMEWFGELVLADRLHTYAPLPEPLPLEARPGWRFAFSTRLQMIAGFDCAETFLAGHMKGADGSYAEEKKWRQDFGTEIRDSKNVFVHICADGWSDFTQVRRNTLAKIRLLRMALHHAVTRELLSLEDPFGTTLLHRMDPAKLVLWSVGMNGTDDGGTGDWEITIRPDLVLGIPRRP